MTQTLPLQAAMDEAYDGALAALTATPWRPSYAVVWLSAHLAAAQHAVYAVIDRNGDERQAAERRGLSHDLLIRLRVLEHVAAGGPSPVGDRLVVVRDDLVRAITTYRESERRLVASLLEQSPMTDTDALRDGYQRAMRRGPTRPHPWMPQRGVAERLAFAVDRVRDHVFDVLDSRPNPVPCRPHRRPKPVGRWGMWAAGGG
jgi:hypothetical protein